ncbi:MAG: formylglycine-generating enzyme family protein [Reyranella sp.]
MIRSRLPILAASLAAVMAGAVPAPAQPPESARIGDFRIDATEVTIGQFRAFARATSLTTAAEREGGGFEYTGGWTRREGWTYERPQGQPGQDSEPAVHVTWAEADAFCRHAGGRLPTFAEWRSAAYTEQRYRPTDGYVRGQTYQYPVGDAPDGMNNNRRAHVPVATTKRGVNGLYDMGANVWEWLADRRGDDALTAGGSWWYGPAQARADGAQWKAAGFHAVYIGFRCAYTPQG